MAAPTPAADAPAIQEKVETADSNGATSGATGHSAQKPVADTHSGFHPFHDLAERFRGAASDHKGDSAERGGLDLEKEIGKRTSSPLPTVKFQI